MRRRMEFGDWTAAHKGTRCVERQARNARKFGGFLRLGLAVLGASVLVCSGLQNARAHDVPSAAAGTALGTSVSVGAGAQGFKAEAAPNGVWLRQILRQQARFWDISYPLLAEGADVCRKLIRPGFGFVAFTRWDIDRYYRIASMSSYGLDDRLRVVHVLPDSPAAKAGLRAGDVIEGIGHHAIPLGRAASAAVDRVVDGEAVVGVAQTFHVRRREQRLALAIAPRMQCDVNLVVTDSDRINAFNDGRTIYVTHGLLRYFNDDRALTAVAAHLIGHGLLEHRAGQGEGAAGTALQGRLESLRLAFLGNDEVDARKRAGTLPGALAYTKEQEIEADRVALELLARAGYPLEVLGEVWDHLPGLEPEAPLLHEFHPTSPDRREALADLVRQYRIELGLGAGEPGL